MKRAALSESDGEHYRSVAEFRKYCSRLNEIVHLEHYGERYSNVGFSVLDETCGLRVRYSGLTRALASTFFDTNQPQHSHSDEYAHRRKRRGKKKKRSQTRNEFEEEAASSNNTIETLRCSTYGESHGIRVHKQVGEMCNMFRHNERYYDENNKDSYDPCAIKVVQIFEEYAWVPIAVEPRFYNRQLKIASAIDFIMMDLHTFELIIVELKTSNNKNDTVFTRGKSSQPCGKMKHPLSGLTATDFNRAWVQVLFSMGMVQDHVPPAFCPKKSVLMFATSQESRCMVYAPPPWADGMEKVRENYMHLVDSMATQQNTENRPPSKRAQTGSESDTDDEVSHRRKRSRSSR